VLGVPASSLSGGRGFGGAALRYLLLQRRRLKVLVLTLGAATLARIQRLQTVTGSASVAGAAAGHCSKFDANPQQANAGVNTNGSAPTLEASGPPSRCCAFSRRA
jgi:hypothetical protein